MPYVFPQECGGRADVRWLHVSSPAAATAPGEHGLLLQSVDSQPLQMNVSRYSWQQLAAARHQHELELDPAHLHLHLDVAHMGVGGDDSWSPSVLPQYTVPPAMYNMAVALRPTVCAEH